MKMNTNFNELETLNREHAGIDFIKTYEVLTTTNLSPIKIRLIELILSFQSNGQHFQMRYETIANRLGSKEATIKNYVVDLKKLGLIETDTKSNFNTQSRKGGRRTAITVEMGNLTNFIKSFQDKNITKEVAGVAKEKKVEPITPEVVTPIEAKQPTQPKKKEIKQPTHQDDATETTMGGGEPENNDMKFEEIDFNTLNKILDYLETRIHDGNFEYNLDEIINHTSTEKEPTLKCLTYLKELRVVQVFKKDGKFLMFVSKENYVRVTGKKIKPAKGKVIKMEQIKLNGITVEIPSNQDLKKFNYQLTMRARKLNTLHEIKLVHSFLELQDGYVYITPSLGNKLIGVSPASFTKAIVHMLEKELIVMNENGGIKLKEETKRMAM